MEELVFAKDEYVDEIAWTYIIDPLNAYGSLDADASKHPEAHRFLINELLELANIQQTGSLKPK